MTRIPSYIVVMVENHPDDYSPACRYCQGPSPDLIVRDKRVQVANSGPDALPDVRRARLGGDEWQLEYAHAACHPDVVKVATLNSGDQLWLPLNPPTDATRS